MTSSRSSHPLKVSLIAIVLGLAYVLSLKNQFVYDDRYLILTRKLVHDLENLSEAFGGQFYRGMNYYRPLSNVSFMLDFRLWGPDPLGFHITNTILIIAAAAALYFLLSRLFSSRHEWLAVLVALGFGVHPAVSSVVMAIGARSDLLCMLFLLLAYLSYTRTGTTSYLVTLLFFGLALLSKETAVTFPILILALDLAVPRYSPRSREVRHLLLRHSPFWAILAAYALIRSYVLPSVASELALDPVITLRSYLYLFQTSLLPTFSLVYEPFFEDWFSWPKAAAAGGLAVILGTLLKITDRQTRKESAFWLVWAVVAFLPTSNIFGQETMFDERYVAFPLIGIITACGLLIYSEFYRVKAYPLIKVALYVSLLALYLGMTVGRTRFWKDDVAFFTRWCETSPTNPTPYNNLACAYKQRGDIGMAMKLFEETIQVSPKNARAYNNLGREYSAQGQFDRAIELFQRAVELKPDFAQAYYNLAFVYHVSDQEDLALKFYEKALLARPLYPAALYGAARIYVETGRSRVSERYYKRAIGIDSEFAPAYIGLSSLYEQEGRRTDAVNLLRQVLEFSPGHKKATKSLSRLRLDE